VTHRNTSSNPSRPQDTPLQLFGATLRQYRKQRRLSQRALAASTGIRNRYISDIERGLHNIAVLMLLRLAHALEIPAACLLARLDTRITLAPLAAGDPLTSRYTPHVVGSYEDTPPIPRGDPATLLRLLGATLRQYRQNQALSQPTLATRAGLTFGYISEIERGQRNLSVLSLVRIADALGLSVAHLLAPLETRQSPSPPLTR
jgi:transcriptional regulator with XRE-family HTH domain